MTAPLLGELVDAVKAHALANYHLAGWDYVVECYSDSELAAEIAGSKATTPAQAIAAVGEAVGLHDAVRQDVRGAGGDDLVRFTPDGQRIQYQDADDASEHRLRMMEGGFD